MSVIATGLKKSPCIFKYICIIRIRQSGTIFDACSGRRYRTVVVTVFDTVVFVTPYSYLFARSYVLNSTTPPPDHGPARFQRLLKDDWLAEWVGGRPYRSNHVKVLWEEERGGGTGFRYDVFKNQPFPFGAGLFVQTESTAIDTPVTYIARRKQSFHRDPVFPGNVFDYGTARRGDDNRGWV